MEITTQSLADMFAYFAQKSRDVTDPKVVEYTDVSERLFQKDYDIQTINNSTGNLCPSYPPRVIVSILPKGTDVPQYTEAELASMENWISNCKNARARQRFPTLAMVFNGRNICRSSTISMPAEQQLRGAVDSLGSMISVGIFGSSKDSNTIDFSMDTESLRKRDAQLLEKLHVKHVFDLMVEGYKKNYGLHVSSSEKVEATQYSNFNLVAMPYPGCEFFKDYHLNQLDGSNLFFDWHLDDDNSASLYIPKTIQNALTTKLNFESWSKLSLNDLSGLYITSLLQILSTPKENLDGGILVHCISGWDRTPLFISLLRLCLWADGEIHQNLSALEICFLTVCYDWMLFGHKFSERYEKNEVVMQFCYLFLDVLSKCNGTSIHLIQNLQRIDKQERDVLLKKSSSSSSSSSSAVPITQAELTVEEKFHIGSFEIVNSNEDHTNFFLSETPPVHSEMFSRFLQAQKNSRCSVPFPAAPLAANIKDASHNVRPEIEDEGDVSGEEDGFDSSLCEPMDDSLFGFEAEDQDDTGKSSINKVEKEEEEERKDPLASRPPPRASFQIGSSRAISPAPLIPTDPEAIQMKLQIRSQRLQEVHEIFRKMYCRYVDDVNKKKSSWGWGMFSS